MSFYLAPSYLPRSTVFEILGSCIQGWMLADVLFPRTGASAKQCCLKTLKRSSRLAGILSNHTIVSTELRQTSFTRLHDARGVAAMCNGVQPAISTACGKCGFGDPGFKFLAGRKHRNRKNVRNTQHNNMQGCLRPPVCVLIRYSMADLAHLQ